MYSPSAENDSASNFLFVTHSDNDSIITQIIHVTSSTCYFRLLVKDATIQIPSNLVKSCCTFCFLMNLVYELRLSIYYTLRIQYRCWCVFYCLDFLISTFHCSLCVHRARYLVLGSYLATLVEFALFYFSSNLSDGIGDVSIVAYFYIFIFNLFRSDSGFSCCSSFSLLPTCDHYRSDVSIQFVVKHYAVYLTARHAMLTLESNNLRWSK